VTGSEGMKRACGMLLRFKDTAGAKTLMDVAIEVTEADSWVWWGGVNALFAIGADKFKWSFASF